jgi:hypothetical protein
MKPENTDLTKELAHQHRMLEILQERRRVLELQAAQRGIDARPEVLTEIVSLNDEIKRHEQELARLATQAAVERFSLDEAEYRVMLAETWSTPLGRPSLVGVARLELARLRMGIPPERAQELEREVRAGLAQEVLAELDIRPLLGITTNTYIQGLGGMTVTLNPTDSASIKIDHLEISQEMSIDDPLTLALRLIGRAVRLDQSTALRLLLVCLPPAPPLEIAAFGSHLLTVNQVMLYPEEKFNFNLFLSELDAMLNAHMSPQESAL